MDLKKHLKLRTIINELNESFDFNNINANEFTKISDEEYESNNLSVEFQEVGIWDLNLPAKFTDANQCYNVLYKVDGFDSQAYKTNYKEFISILKTVKEIVEDFIKNNEPDILVIIAADRGGEVKVDNMKDKVYRAIIAKHIPHGYASFTSDSPIKGSTLNGVVLHRLLTFESITYKTGKRKTGR